MKQKIWRQLRIGANWAARDHLVLSCALGRVQPDFCHRRSDRVCRRDPMCFSPQTWPPRCLAMPLHFSFRLSKWIMRLPNHSSFHPLARWFDNCCLFLDTWICRRCRSSSNKFLNMKIGSRVKLPVHYISLPACAIIAKRLRGR